MLKKLKEKFMNRQFLTFCFIGAFNTIGSLVIYMILVALHLAVGISSLIGDTVTMIGSYFLNMRFTYHEKPNLKSFISFPASYIPGILINMVFTIVLVDFFGAPELIAKALALPITIPVNYLTMSIIVKWARR